LKIFRIIKNASEDPNPLRKIFAHCTVGEDRTGAVVGLYRLLQHPTWDTYSVFIQDMCVRGYEAGDPRKMRTALDDVILPMRRELTPFFLKMAKKIKKGQLRWFDLRDESCDEEPAVAPDEAAPYI